MNRVLIISLARSIGGGEIYLSGLVPNLKKNGLDVEVLAGHKVRKTITAIKSKSLLLFPKWLELSLPRNYQLRKWYYKLCFRLIHPVKRYQLISLQEYDGAVIEAIKQRPLLLTLHTRFLIPEKFNPAVRRHFNKIDKVICVSQQTKKDLVSRGVPANKCVVIHSAIDPAKYDLNPKPGEFITWVGRVEKADKNPELFIAIARHSQNSGAGYKFRVVGTGSYLQELKGLAKDLSNVEFFGFCPPNEMYEIYKQASILCMTSTSEGLPFVALEAMASGVPIVATNVGGLPELIDSASVGSLVESFDETKLFNEIERLLKEPATYSQISKAARQRVEKEFNIETASQQTLAVYRELLK